MRLMITRPSEDAGPLADVLHARGIDTLTEPLLSIAIEDGPALALDGVQAFLISSANGARALAARTPDRTLPIYAVGDASARESRGVGFSNVMSAGGDVDDLARLVAQNADPKKGALLHAAGSRVAGDLKGYLEDAGFAYRRAVLYTAQPATTFSDDGQCALAQGDVDGVLFFSPRTAATFVKLMMLADLVAACGALTAYCLSPAVAEKLSGLGWQDIVVAEKPDQDALLSALKMN